MRDLCDRIGEILETPAGRWFLRIYLILLGAGIGAGW